MVGQSPQNGTIREVCIDISRISPGHAEIIAEQYGFGIIGDTLQGETNKDVALRAGVDVGFVAIHPNLPAENVTNWLDNYIPWNPSQSEMLAAAQKLVAFRSLSRMAGLLICGPPGVGKTHIAVGVAKASMLTDQSTKFINTPTAGQVQFSTGEAEKIAKNADSVVIDDVTSVDFLLGSFIGTLISNMHNRGSGKLLLTSNYASPEDLIHDLLTRPGISPADSLRLADRIGSSIMGLSVEGTSYRQVRDGTQAHWWAT